MSDKHVLNQSQAFRRKGRYIDIAGLWFWQSSYEFVDEQLIKPDSAPIKQGEETGASTVSSVLDVMLRAKPDAA